jgi:hypothetical protein
MFVSFQQPDKEKRIILTFGSEYTTIKTELKKQMKIIIFLFPQRAVK